LLGLTQLEKGETDLRVSHWVHGMPLPDHIAKRASTVPIHVAMPVEKANFSNPAHDSNVLYDLDE
jgi:hypothetical protein